MRRSPLILLLGAAMIPVAAIRAQDNTAGTSAPEAKVQEVLEKLRVYGASEVCEMEGERETMYFRLPESLWPQKKSFDSP